MEDADRPTPRPESDTSSCKGGCRRAPSPSSDTSTI